MTNSEQVERILTAHEAVLSVVHALCERCAKGETIRGVGSDGVYAHMDGPCTANDMQRVREHLHDAYHQHSSPEKKAPNYRWGLIFQTA